MPVSIGDITALPSVFVVRCEFLATVMDSLYGSNGEGAECIRQ